MISKVYYYMGDGDYESFSPQQEETTIPDGRYRVVDGKLLRIFDEPAPVTGQNVKYELEILQHRMQNLQSKIEELANKIDCLGEE